MVLPEYWTAPDKNIQMIVANAMNATETKAIFCLRTTIRLFLDTSPECIRLDVLPDI